MDACSLSEALTVGLHPEQKRRLTRIDTEDFSEVARKVAEHLNEAGVMVSREYLRQGIFALKQYYAVALIDPANAHAISRPLDPFWHAHILYTEAYTRFCIDVVGEYMHHRPLNHANLEQVALVRRLYSYTRTVLEQTFYPVQDDFWPKSVRDDYLICMHRGNQDIYTDVQSYRLFSPDLALAG